MTDTSLPTMAKHTEKQRPNNGQLIFVPHEDTIRLMEVFVKRSLSFNDGTLLKKRKGRGDKWVTKQYRRHSSELSFYPNNRPVEIEAFSAVEPTTDLPETFPEVPEKQNKRSKKKKKSSIWKNILGFFSGKSSQDKDEEQDSATEMPRGSKVEQSSEAAITCSPTQKKGLKRKTLKRRFSKRRLSLIKQNKQNKDLHTADISDFEDVRRVEPTYSYYEKVSEELEKIVLEGKEEDQPLSNEDVINRIVALTKEEGDAIDNKMKENPTLNTFFQGMSYSSFQKLADTYLEEKATPTHAPLTVPPTAPELVKLAFTLDFTARVAGLSRQNIGHITVLGNLYLQDRFKYNQACTDHPWSDTDD